MLSLQNNFATGEPFLVCLSKLFLVLLFLSSSGIHGASLREHRLRGSESDSQIANAYQAPNADMLKALEYIENLRQRSGTDSQQRAPPSTGYNGSRMDDAETLRAMLRLASSPYHSKDENEEEEEAGEDKSEELLQAVLSTLQQTEKASKLASPHPSVEGAGQRVGAYPRVQEKHRGIKPHRKLPLMFEDEEEEEEGKRDEGEDEEGPDLEHDSPFKRTNENVEEKYTPQNLATLQSVFDELDKLTGVKTAHQRQAEEDDVEEGGEEDKDDMFNVRNVAYDDAGGDLNKWGPLQEREEEEEKEEKEEEEEERGNKQEASQGLEYVDDNDEEADEEDEEEGDDSYLFKRSDDDPDDVANMVDYYLLKVLETTEEEQKRALEEEEEEEEENERAERRATPSRYRDNIDPRAIYRLIQISQKYQIPPEDLLDMLKTGEMTYQDTTPRVNKLSRTGNRLSQIFPKTTYKIPEAKFYNRRLPVRQKTPEERRTEEILKILGLGAGEDRLPVRKQRPYKSSLSRLRTLPAGRPGESAPTQRRLPGTLKGKYDDAVDEDELAAYLAAQMLAQYPKPAYGSKKASQKRDKVEQSMTDSFEQAIQDYFEQMDSDKSQRETRRSDGGSSNAQTQSFDSEAMMKLLSYLNPETEESLADGTTANGI